MRILLLGILLVLAGCSRKEAAPAREPPGHPNILLISVESLRADHIGCYGYERDTTPNIDALAAEATTFDRAYAVTSWTLTSHATMFTGLYPTAHKVALPKDRLSDAYTTLAELLSGGGSSTGGASVHRAYQTAAVVSGPYLRKSHNLHQGFEYYDASPITPPKQAASRDVTNPRMAESMARFLNEKRDPNRPFFLFAYYWDPHHDYIPPAPYNTMFVPPGAEKPKRKVRFDPVFKLGKHITPAQLLYLVAQYDGEIRCTDDYLGRIWTLLRELGLWDTTAIILTADHGEEFYEHGHNGHKNSLYVESLHVPLIVKWPGQRQPVRDSRVVNLIDLFPTVLELAGCEASQPHSGMSLLDPPPGDERATYFELTTTWWFRNRKTGEKWHESDDWVAVRRGRYKLINVRNKDRWELYDLIADPRERSPLTDGHRTQLAGLKERIEHWHRSMTELADLRQRGPEAQLTPEQEERLRSLGYLP